MAFVAAVGCVLVMALPRGAAAQSVIAGVVKDTSGAVLPGVTVEASSPALIEKVRTVTTDDAGQFRIVDLRPGAYTVVFTLAGFSSVRREGIELTTNFTASINAEMRVGSLAESITVTERRRSSTCRAPRRRRSCRANCSTRSQRDEASGHWAR